MFDQSDVASIVSHMNEDHADAVALYLRFYAGIEGASEVQMISIDANGMGISFSRDKVLQSARVLFEPPLQDASEVRPRLVAMVKIAREKLQG